MGVVIPFEAAAARRARASPGVTQETDSSDPEMQLATALLEGCDQRGILAAAGPLLDRCRDRYGFIVMRAGLPSDPADLAGSLVTLSRGLGMLGVVPGAGRSLRTYGAYLGQRELAWFEDGYGGETGLAVPLGIDAAALAAFVRPRLLAARSI